MTVDRSLRRVGLAFALVVLTACGVGTEGSSGEPETSTSTDESTSTTDVALSTTGEAVSGGATGTIVSGDGRAVSFVVDTEGNARFADQQDGSVVAFDATDLISWATVEDVMAQNLGHSPSGPDSKAIGMSYDSDFVWDMALRRSRDSGDNELSWTVSARGDTELGESQSIDCDYDVVLDPETRLMMSYAARCHERAEVRWTVVDFERRSSADHASFDPASDAAASDDVRIVSDQGFRYSTLDEARRSISYPLPVPEVPSGYVLDLVTWTPHAAESPMEVNGMPSREVVVMVYRDGFQTVTVTTRAFVATRDLGDGETAPVEWFPWSWHSPLSTVNIDGAIDGQATRFTAFPDVSWAWAVTDEVVITVEGALSETELADVLASFHTDA